MKRSFQNLLCFIDIIILPLLILKSGFSLFTYSNVSIIFILIFIALLIYLIKNNEVNLIVSYVVISAIGIIPLIQFHGADIYTYSEMKVNYLYMLSIIIGILLVTRLKHVKYKMFIFDYILCLYWLLTLISTFLSVDVNISIFGTAGRYEGLVTISCYILLYFLASKFLTSYTTLNFKFIIISATIIGIYAIMQYYGIDPFHQIYKYLLGNEAYSTIGNRDFVGSYITLLLPILIYTFISTKKYIYILSSGILFTSMLCINARSAWVAFIVYIFILSIFIFMKKYKRRNFILLIALFTIIFIVFNFRQNNMLSSRIVSINSDAKTLVQNKSPESIDNGRYFIWERAIKIIPKFPLLGSGP
ncbi:MAG TPA: O-antigen ligase family protein, partial [Clostridiaceae bacterium]